MGGFSDVLFQVDPPHGCAPMPHVDHIPQYKTNKTLNRLRTATSQLVAKANRGCILLSRIVKALFTRPMRGHVQYLYTQADGKFLSWEMWYSCQDP